MSNKFQKWQKQSIEWVYDLITLHWSFTCILLPPSLVSQKSREISDLLSPHSQLQLRLPCVCCKAIYGLFRSCTGLDRRHAFFSIAWRSFISLGMGIFFGFHTSIFSNYGLCWKNSIQSELESHPEALLVGIPLGLETIVGKIAYFEFFLWLMPIIDPPLFLTHPYWPSLDPKIWVGCRHFLSLRCVLGSIVPE